MRTPLAVLHSATPVSGMAIGAQRRTPYAMPTIPFASGVATAVPANVFHGMKPWTMSAVDVMAFQDKLAAVDTPAVSATAQLAAMAPTPFTALFGKGKENAKKGTHERVYTVDEFRRMLDQVVSRQKSARKAADEAGFPSAKRSLQRHARAVLLNPALQRSSPTAQLAAQRAGQRVEKVYVRIII